MREFAPVYCNTVSLIMGGTVLVEVTEKFKDVGTTDYGLVWDTDLVETLGLENYINLAGHERYSAMTLAECLPGSSETAGIPADVGVIMEPVDCRLLHCCQQCTSTLGALLKIRLFPDWWQPVRLTVLQTRVPTVLVPTFCLTLWVLAARLRLLRLSW